MSSFKTEVEVLTGDLPRHMKLFLISQSQKKGELIVIVVLLQLNTIIRVYHISTKVREK